MLLGKYGNLKSERTHSLFTLLVEAQHFEASGCRDRIVALLGIASDRESVQFSPNYALPAKESFVDFARTYAEAYRVGKAATNIWNLSGGFLPGLKFLPPEAEELLLDAGCIQKILSLYQNPEDKCQKLLEDFPDSKGGLFIEGSVSALRSTEHDRHRLHRLLDYLLQIYAQIEGVNSHSSYPNQ